MWIVNSFVSEHTERTQLGNLMESLLDLHTDFMQKSSFTAFDYNGDFCVSLIQFPEYQTLAEEALSILVHMVTTYLSEKGFSALVDIKTKKRNALLDLDPLMRGALETSTTPCYDAIADQMQEQRRH